MRQLARGIPGKGRLPTGVSLAKGIAIGRMELIRSTRHDFGYDLQAWHDYLVTSPKVKLYQPGDPGQYPVWISSATNDPQRQEAVRYAEAENLLDRVRQEKAQRRQAEYEADRRWSGKTRTCLRCETEFTSCQDQGQCPQCQHIFWASHPNGNFDWWRKDEAE